MKKLLFALLMLSTPLVYADEVFKCQQKSGKTIYQEEPCNHAEKQQTIEIPKTDPQKMAEEAAKLKAWEADFAQREAERARIEKEQQDEKDRKAALEALKQNAEYQKRRTEEPERPTYPYQFYPYYFPHQPHYYPSTPKHHKHEPHVDNAQTAPPQPPADNGVKLPSNGNAGLEPKKLNSR
ncbi:MAG: DUF4124 domain-containing protein [Methylobacter sp.]